MAYYNGYYYKRSFRGFFTCLFLAMMVVIIVAAIPTREDFTHNNRTGSGQTENKKNNKPLGQKDPAQYEEQDYHEWSNPAEF